MQTKLTLRMEDSVVRKAKRLARQRGTSVSRVFSEYIAQQEEPQGDEAYGEITASMIGVLHGMTLDDEKKAYREHLAEKYQ